MMMETREQSKEQYLKQSKKHGTMKYTQMAYKIESSC